MSDELKTKLAHNAFDFLETAIEQFDKEPKYSIINFATAVELFLKLRLVHEHWTLICTSKCPSLLSLMDGSASTINFNDIMPKIESITDNIFPRDTKKCFKEIANHRNRIVHFFHGDLLEEKEKEKIVSEELRGWQHLKVLIFHWDFIIDNDASQFRKKIRYIDNLMKDNRKFLQQKYDSLKSEIQEDIRNGYDHIECPICKFPAYEVEEEPDIPEKDYLGLYACRVCDFAQLTIEIPCPEKNCGGIIQLGEKNDLISIKDTECSKCGIGITNDYIRGVLDTRTEEEISKARKLGGDVGYPNCSCCGNVECVVEVASLYICTNCVTVTGEMNQCIHCGIWYNSSVDPVLGCSNCNWLR